MPGKVVAGENGEAIIETPWGNRPAAGVKGALGLENGAETETLFVAGGFAEVAPDRCTILADEVTPLASLSRGEAERRLTEAEAAYADVGAEETPEKREAAMNRVLAMRAMRDAAQAA